jgi:hypothetical protein
VALPPRDDATTPGGKADAMDTASSIALLLRSGTPSHDDYNLAEILGA